MSPANLLLGRLICLPTCSALSGSASLLFLHNLRRTCARLCQSAGFRQDDRFIQNYLADYLVRDHKETEAADIAAKMTSATTGNPDALNNAAYVMAEANGDLALAEKTSKESLDVLDS